MSLVGAAFERKFSREFHQLKMPAGVAWRSYVACSSSCSVAELQEIANGINGFSLPTEPCNEVYPGIYLGDA